MATVFDINAFKAQVGRTGFLQTNKYVVYISPNSKLTSSFINSPVVSQNFREIGNDMQYRCVMATLPGMVLRTTDVNRMGLGNLEKMPFSGVYTDINLGFLCDRYGAAYNFWYAWINFIHAMVGRETGKTVDNMTPGPKNGKREYYTTQYKNDYIATVNVFVYDNFGKRVIAYTLYNAYPTAIMDSPLSWGDNNNLLKLSVTLTFREWAIDEGEVQIATTRRDTGPIGRIFDPTSA